MANRSMIATYRLQLTPSFGFDEAAAIVPYLAELGISHVYCSPFLQAVSGSVHGYDVVDHGRVNGELGGDAGLARLREAVEQAGLGVIVDIVPNHMAIGTDTLPVNERWWKRAARRAGEPRRDVLRHRLGRPRRDGCSCPCSPTRSARC